MFDVFRVRVRAAIADTATKIGAAVREVLRPTPMVSGLVSDLFRSRDELVAENALLRQQLIVASRKVKQPAFRPLERGLLVALASVVQNWQRAVLLVKPETVLRWHREGFRLLWKRKSRTTRQRKPRISAETIELIRDMAIRSRTWGAERILGELLKLGIRLSKRTIQRHILAVRPPGDGQRWRTFLKNHIVWAVDFVQVYDIWFTAPSALPRYARAVGLRATRPLRGLRALRHRPLFAFFVIDVNEKEVVHVAVTRTPNAAWTAQQLRQLTPFGKGPQFIIRDRDNKFSADFDRVARGAGIRVLKTAVQAPLMNSTCERFIGSVRRECLDHVIVLGEAHLRALLVEWVAHFNRGRPHQALEQRVPVPSGEPLSSEGGSVVAIPVLGGLHHDYQRAA